MVGVLDYVTMFEIESIGTTPTLADGSSQDEYRLFNAQTINLDGTYYLIWSCSCFLTVAGSGLHGHLLGKIVNSFTAGAVQDSWFSHYSLGMFFLLNSMDSSLAQGYLSSITAAQIRKAIKDTYSTIQNKAQVFELKRKIHTTQQMD